MLFVKRENHRFSEHNEGELNEEENSLYDEVLFFRPFREINISNNSKSWDRVHKLEKGKVYVEVNRLENV